MASTIHVIHGDDLDTDIFEYCTNMGLVSLQWMQVRTMNISTCIFHEVQTLPAVHETAMDGSAV